MILICPSAGDVNFDHLIKVVSAKILHRKVNYFSLCNY